MPTLPLVQATPFYCTTAVPVQTALPLPAPAESSIGGGCGRNLAGRTAWSDEEDAMVVRSVREHGCKWRQIAALFPGRSDDAIRNRWKRVRYLPEHNGGVDVKPPDKLKHVAGAASLEEKAQPERVSWSAAEDDMIMNSIEELGHRWQKIAERLPGRTEHAIRNRFARLMSLASRGQPVVMSSGHGVPIGIQLVPQSG